MGSEIVQWNNYMLKNVVSKKFICLDYIKLHGAHGNPSRAVAGSEARPLYLQKKNRLDPCTRYIFSCSFPSTTNSRRTNCQLLTEKMVAN